MKCLLTGAGSELGRKLIAPLAQTHQTLATDALAGPGVGVVADLTDPAAVSSLLAGQDAVIHATPLAAGERGEPLDVGARGTYNLLLGAAAAGVRRFVLLSTLRLFDRYPPRLAVESFRPRPTASPRDLAPYLSEVVAREVTRVSPLTTVCLRLGEVVDDEEGARSRFDPRWVHLDDVVQAVDRALVFEPEASWPGNSFNPYHIVAPGGRSRHPLGAAARNSFGYAPSHDFARWSGAPSEPASGAETEPLTAHVSPTHAPPRRIVIYGAGGPLGAAAAEVLSADRVLRLTDIRSLAEIHAEGRAQSPGAPIAHPFGPPHEEMTVDVGDEPQAVAAAGGMDAIVNCTVVRPDPAGAFRVNLLGAYNVCRAALANGIRRVVHTGPQQTTAGARDFHGYAYDFGIVDDVPSRPGASLYLLTKLLGQEVCRVFAEDHGLEIPALLFTSFVNPEVPPEIPNSLYPMAVSWPDAGRAVKAALDAPLSPGLEPIHILTDLPHGKYTNGKARRLLRWTPQDRLERQVGS